MRAIMFVAVALAVAASATLDLFFGPDGQRAGTVREGPSGQVDVFDRESRRVGWGWRNANGSVEPFDVRGNRIGTMTRDGVIRLERR